MKKSFHVFFLFVLFAFFATAQSWAYVNNIVTLPGGTITTGYPDAPEGETIYLSISPSPDYVFAGLEVKEDETGNDVAVVISGPTAVYTMPASDVTVTPTWKKQHSVTIANVTGGTVETYNAKATQGETVTLMIYPAGDYLFDALEVTYGTNNSTVDVAVSDGKTSATFTMPDGDVTVTPAWKKQYLVKILKGNGGEVLTDKAKAMQGETVTLTINPKDHYSVRSLEVEDADENPVTVTLSSDKSSATFTMPASNVSVWTNWDQLHDVKITSVTGGTVTTDKEAAAGGQTVTLTITPADRYALTRLDVMSADEAVNVVYSEGKATFTMPDYYSVTVTPFWDVNVLTDDGEGKLYVNMPETGTKTVVIPEDVASFKVYDDGGENGNHSLNANGYLVLNAPKGYQLQVTGTARYDYAYFFIYDGDSEAKKLFDEDYATNGIDVGTVRSSGNKLTVYFKSRNGTVGSNLSGLDLTVSLVKVDFGAVSIAKADDGKLHATINGDYEGTEALKITEAITVDNVELNREFSTNGQGFSTIVLPFGFNAAALTGVKSVVEFTGMTKDGDVGMSYIWCSEEVQDALKEKAAAEGKGENYDHCNTDKTNFPGDMLAYWPYMVQMKDAQIGFMDVAGGITLEMTPDADEIKVIDGEWEFHGTIANKNWTKEDTKDGNVWAYAAKVQDAAKYVGQFVMLGAGAYTPPLRAYMVKKSKPQLVAPKNGSSAAKFANANKSVSSETASLDHINVVIVSRSDNNEEHRTVIGTLNTRTGEFKMLRDYDLKGRKVNGVNRARGAYYGKKVLKK